MDNASDRTAAAPGGDGSVSQPLAGKRDYAALIEWGARVCTWALITAGALYVFHLLPAVLPPEQVAVHWGRRASEFVAATQSPRGWDWLARLQFSDCLCQAGMVLLVLLTIPAYAILVWRNRRSNHLYACIAAAEIVVLVLAAAGVFQGGH